MKPFEFQKAIAGSDALDLKEKMHGAFIAGGTNIIDLMKEGVMQPAALIDITALHELMQITEANGLHIGALVSNADTAYDPVVETKYPLLSKAILAGASPQLRNMATNGGNLMQRTRCAYFYDTSMPCNKREPGTGCAAIGGVNRMHAILGTSEHCIAVYPSDMAVALAALDANVHVMNKNASRIIPIKDFHCLPGNTPHIDNTLAQDEIITSIEIPANKFDKNYAYLKIRDRSAYAFALVSVATAFVIEGEIISDARIALGGVAHKPWRVEEAESFLIGKEANDINFSTAADIILKGAKGFGENNFKIPLAKNAIIRNAHDAAQQPSR